jgi:integrase
VLFDSFLAAKRMLESIRHDYDKDRLKFDPTKWSRLGRKACTLRECAREWQPIVDKTCSRVHAKHVESFFRLHINPALGDLDVREITPDDIERFHLSLLDKGYQPKTVRDIMTTLKTLFRRIHEKMRLIDIVPSFPTIRVPKKIRGWIDRDVQDAVLQFMPDRTHLLMEIMFETGIRPGEAVALRAKSLVDGGVYVDAAMGSDRKLKTTKTGHEEHYPLSASLFLRIKQHADGKLPEAFEQTFRSMGKSGEEGRGDRADVRGRAALQGEQILQGAEGSLSGNRASTTRAYRF